MPRKHVASSFRPFTRICREKKKKTCHRKEQLLGKTIPRQTRWQWNEKKYFGPAEDGTNWPWQKLHVTSPSPLIYSELKGNSSEIFGHIGGSPGSECFASPNDDVHPSHVDGELLLFSSKCTPPPHTHPVSENIRRNINSSPVFDTQRVVLLLPVPFVHG